MAVITTVGGIGGLYTHFRKPTTAPAMMSAMATAENAVGRVAVTQGKSLSSTATGLPEPMINASARRSLVDRTAAEVGLCHLRWVVGRRVRSDVGSGGNDPVDLVKDFVTKGDLDTCE